MPCCTASSIDIRSQSRISSFCARIAFGPADRIAATQSSTAASSCFGGDDPLDHAARRGFLRVDVPAGEHQFAGLAPADQLRQQAGLHARGQAEQHLRHAELRGVAAARMSQDAAISSPAPKQ
jgi:hypothetical protein